MHIRASIQVSHQTLYNICISTAFKSRTIVYSIYTLATWFDTLATRFFFGFIARTLYHYFLSSRYYNSIIMRMFLRISYLIWLSEIFWAHTHAHTQIHTCKHTHKNTHIVQNISNSIFAGWLIFPGTHTRTHARTHAHIHAHIHHHIHAHTLTHTHTHAHTRTHTYAALMHARTHARTLARTHACM